MKRILFLLPVNGQPRFHKRIQGLKESGFHCQALYFDRPYFEGKKLPCSAKSIGRTKQGAYLRRLYEMLLAVRIVRQHIEKVDVVYAFGLDMLLLARWASRREGRVIIYEIGDIRRIQIASGLVSKVVRIVERYTVLASQMLVVTSPGYLEGYYRPLLKREMPCMIIENKLQSPVVYGWRDTRNLFLKNGIPLVDRMLRVGYFGLLRCEWSWKVLEMLAGRYPGEVQIMVAGRPLNPPDLVRRAEALSNVKYFGEFRSPDDLPRIYDSVDVIWGCYPRPMREEKNWLWARTNRYYEACFFRKPIIALFGSADAHEVERYNIGMSVEGGDVAKTVDLIVNTIPLEYRLWLNNLANLPKEVFLYTTEHRQLAEKIRKLINENRYN